MVSGTQSSLLGIGVYALDEAARYARVTTRTMRRWLFGDDSSSPVIRAQLAGEVDSEKLVTFLDFVQVMAIRQVRLREKSFPLQRIRKACDIASDKYGLDYPLAAKEHRIYLFGPKDKLAACEMVILVGHGEDEENVYLQLTGKASGNFVMAKIAEPFMSQVKFGDSQFAEEYIAWEKNGRQIVMNPHHRLGEPYLPSCGYTAQGLWDAYRSENGVQEAANAYGVEPEDVDLVCGYFDFLIGPEAA